MYVYSITMKTPTLADMDWHRMIYQDRRNSRLSLTRNAMPILAIRSRSQLTLVPARETGYRFQSRYTQHYRSREMVKAVMKYVPGRARPLRGVQRSMRIASIVPEIRGGAIRTAAPLYCNGDSTGPHDCIIFTGGVVTCAIKSLGCYNIIDLRFD